MGIKNYIKLNGIEYSFLDVCRGDVTGTAVQHTAQAWQAVLFKLFDASDIENLLNGQTDKKTREIHSHPLSASTYKVGQLNLICGTCLTFVIKVLGHTKCH